LSLSSEKYGLGIRDPGSEIRDPGSGKNLFRIPDPGVKKEPDPGSGSATLLATIKTGSWRYLRFNFYIKKIYLMLGYSILAIKII
jgi:hypothetical protein